MLLKSSFLLFMDSLSQILTYNKAGTENPKLTLFFFFFSKAHS